MQFQSKKKSKNKAQYAVKQNTLCLFELFISKLCAGHPFNNVSGN